MLYMEIGGTGFSLDPAGISAIRYRCAYGDSVVNHLRENRTERELEGLLVRMLHMMIPPGERPGLLDFARLARREPDFAGKALTAEAALMAQDPQWELPRGGSQEPFDEYLVLALLAAGGVGLRLIYELPILHLAGIANRVFDLKNPDSKQYHLMTPEEMAELYPR